MIFQRFLARIDELISMVFNMNTLISGDAFGYLEQIHFATAGSKIGIMGTDGRIHTIMGYWAVRHYYGANGKLLKRISVRNDLKPGERLATDAEIQKHQIKRALEFARGHGFIEIS